MHFRCLSCVVALSVASLCLYGSLREVSSLSVLADAILAEQLDGALVLFDVDDVLISSVAEFDFRSEVRRERKQELKKRYSKAEIDLMFSDFFLKRRVELVDPKMPELLKDLSDRGAFVTALSAWWTGAFGYVDRMELLRLKELEEVGISFERSSPFREDVVFSSYFSREGRNPMVIAGIILTALSDKGEVLGLALDYAPVHFDTIIFIDDKLMYLEQVQDFCAKRGIAFVGFHYTEASSRPVLELDPVIEVMRFRVLEEEHVWLSDEELLERD